jgi:hypothetical protein
MAGHNSVLTIEKLEERRNYSVWRTQMKYYLIHEELWDLVSNEPTTATERKRDLRALNKIGLLVQPKRLVHLQAAETTKTGWGALQTAFEDKNRRCVLLGKLFGIKLKHHTSMDSYVTQVLSTAQEMASIGKALDDDLIAALLLQGLPNDYKPMKMAIENSGIELTTDSV